MLIHGPFLCSEYTDPDGNYRATNPKYPDFVGYGRSREEAQKNLSKAIGGSEKASRRAAIEAMFMGLSEQEQTDLLASLPKLRRS